MKRNVWTIMALTAVFLLVPSTAMALGPVDVEGRVMYWQGDTEIDGETADMDGYGAEFDLWFTKQAGCDGGVLAGGRQGPGGWL